ncbi:hypothetical protein M8J76_012852 [Diaphorina citri]|nr:hypothetical protein M8J76_012852 [Diaphorina citri]
MRADYTQAYINRGDVLLKLNRTKEAQEVYERALFYDSSNPDIYYNLGVVFLEQNKSSQALAYLDKALEFDPDHAQALFNSAIILTELGRPDFRKIARERLLKLLHKAYFAYSEPCLMLNSHVLFTADLWSMLTLSGGSDVETSSLAQQSVLIILILANHCVSPTFSNPYRDALSNLQDNLNSLYTVLCNEVKHEEITLLLYHLLHRNNAFKIFVLSRTDMELLVLPILRTIYHAADTSCHHIYMSLIILLILTEDPLFNKTIHSTVLKSVPWYTERLMTEISLGGLMILVTTRTVQYNILKMRDKYLHTNCLAALANMSSQFTNLHPYVCQRVIGLFEVLAKTHSRGCQEQVNAVEEALRIVLEVINSCIYNQLIHNINLVITYFSAKLEKEEDQSVDVNEVQSKVNRWSMSFPKALLKTFPELKFKYVEEERPEEFFIPYVWSLVIRHAPIYWNSALYKIATGEESM